MSQKNEKMLPLPGVEERRVHKNAMGDEGSVMITRPRPHWLFDDHVPTRRGEQREGA